MQVERLVDAATVPDFDDREGFTISTKTLMGLVRVRRAG
jgi:hypothetical protein